ncbi:cellulose synthase [Allorhizobium undicola]|uniref:cellulose synthase n=1 Tax=Allorhizobium undicola TaxID=78527 RepID=UPI003D34F95B
MTASASVRLRHPMINARTRGFLTASLLAALSLTIAMPGTLQAQELEPGAAGSAEDLHEGGFRLLAEADLSLPQTVAQAAPPSPAPQAAAATQDVDESALRYFAARGDTARLEAEISRLKALYPNWRPPADPLTVPANPDRQMETLWRLYSEGRYGDVRKAINDRLAAEQGWTPPEDLLERLAAAETRLAIIDASDKGRFEEVIAKAAATPSLLNCSDVDVLWRLAEAFGRTGRTQRSLDAYGYILKTCQAAPERIATVQKASALLPYPAMMQLLALEKPAASGAREFDGIRDDLARHFAAEANKDQALTLDPLWLERLRVSAEGGNSSDATLLGWYAFRRSQYADAERWFRLANDRKPQADPAQGLALTLIERKAFDQAEDALYRFRDANEDSRKTYFAATANLLAQDPPALLSPEVLTRISRAVMAGRDAASAQQFGWYARALNQGEAARRWLQTALSWKADDEPSAYGLALTLDQQKNAAALAALKGQWADRSPRIAEVGLASATTAPEQPAKPARMPAAHVPASQRPASSATASPGDAAFSRPAASPAAASGSGACAAQGAGSPALSLSAGWCLMRINRPLEAALAFEQALQSRQPQERSDAAYGLSLAYLRLGLTGKAAVAATRAPLAPAKAMEVQASILSDRAIAAFNAKLYKNALLLLDQRAAIAPERTDLMVLRGYSYLSLKMYGDAVRIFEAAAATGNTDARRGLNDARQAINTWAGIR